MTIIPYYGVNSSYDFLYFNKLLKHPYSEILYKFLIPTRMGLYPYKKHPPPFRGSGIIENHVLLKQVLGGRAYASRYTAMLAVI